MLNDSLARKLQFAGRVGFWAQLVVGSISLLMAISAFVVDRTAGVGTRGTVALIQYLTIGSLLILLFTTVWSYRYILAGRDIDDGRPVPETLPRTVWTGVVASTIGIVFSMLIILFEVTQLFLYFLRAPQAGVPVVQTTSGPTSWVSAGDILSLTVFVLTTFVEVLVLALALWLLFSITYRQHEASR